MTLAKKKEPTENNTKIPTVKFEYLKTDESFKAIYEGGCRFAGCTDIKEESTSQLFNFCGCREAVIGHIRDLVNRKSSKSPISLRRTCIAYWTCTGGKANPKWCSETLKITYEEWCIQPFNRIHIFFNNIGIQHKVFIAC